VIRRLALLGAASTLLGWASPALAEDLVVRRDVTVREAPLRTTKPVDYVAPGDRLELLDAGRVRNGYYHVRLPDGREGWVYRTFVRRVGESELALGSRPLPDWAFVFKFNVHDFPSGGPGVDRPCPFGGSPVDYPGGFSQAYASASKGSPALAAGPGLIGTSAADPLGAAFGRIYDGTFSYVVWNDQFYGKPPIAGCADFCSGPWGHSKGVVAWNDSGEGLLIQVTTPSWPASGSKDHPRPGDGNTLGCIVHPNNLKFSQHFFSLKLSADDVGHVLDALANASAVSDARNPVLVRAGGPRALKDKAAELGRRSAGRTIVDVTLSTGVRLIGKPSALNVPPWQMLSAKLGSVPLRAATWWMSPAIPTTTASTPIACWDDSLPRPGAVEIATSGTWAGRTIDLKGGSGNHAKFGVSLDRTRPYVVFGDLNQQGTLSGPDCAISQNGRGGMFFVIEDRALHSSVSALVAGSTAPAQ
jgi:hypothetical protein